MINHPHCASRWMLDVLQQSQVPNLLVLEYFLNVVDRAAGNLVIGASGDPFILCLRPALACQSVLHLSPQQIRTDFMRC